MIPIDLDIDMLRCFMEVAKTGSFTIAGKNVGLTQSGVSVKIRRLEERLSAAVFNRTSKSLALTAEGELLMQYAGRILAVHDEAVSRFMRPEASGRLRIGLIDYFLPELLPVLLNKFKQRYPNIQLEVQTDVGINLGPLFEAGKLDLLVAGEDSYSGHSRILAQEPLVWVVGSGFDQAPADSLPLVLLPAPCSFREIAIEKLDKADMKWELLFTGTSLASIQAAVQAGMGLSILPKGAVKEGLQLAPSYLNLPDLPMFSLALVMDEAVENDARDVFVGYLEAELRKLK